MPETKEVKYDTKYDINGSTRKTFSPSEFFDVSNWVENEGYFEATSPTKGFSAVTISRFLQSNGISDPDIRIQGENSVVGIKSAEFGKIKSQLEKVGEINNSTWAQYIESKEPASLGK